MMRLCAGVLNTHTQKEERRTELDKKKGERVRECAQASNRVTTVAATQRRRGMK